MPGRAVAVLVLVASCLIACVAPVAASSRATPAASESSPWYQTDYGAALSRANSSEHVLTTSAVPNVTYLRSLTAPPTPPGAQCGPESIVAPALVGGYVYAITNSRLSKYDAATGQLIWRRTPDPTFFAEYQSLSVSSNGMVVVGGAFCDSSSEPSSEFWAYNAATGKLVWSSIGEALSQEVVSNGYVVAAGIDAAGYFFEVLNLSDGKVAWSYVVSCMPYPTTPLVVGSLAMSHGCDSQGNPILEARNLSTGAVVWSLPDDWTFQRGNSTVNIVFATDSAGAVMALNSLTGQTKYTLSGAVNMLAVDTTRAYATCGSTGQYVCAYSLSTGALEWQTTNATGTVLAAEADGVLYLDSGLVLNASTGQVTTTLYGYSHAATALAVGDGRIAVVTDPRVLDLYGLPGY